MSILYLTIGLILGFAIGFLLRKTRNNDENLPDSELETYKIQQAKLDTQLELLNQEKDSLNSSLSNERGKNESLIAQNHEYKKELENLNQKLQEQQEEVKNLQQKFTLEFENIANKILKQNTVEFSETNQKKLDEILNPLKEKLGQFEEKVQNTYEKGLKERSTLTEQIKLLADLNKQMHTDAQNLTKALTGDSKTQGNWGEIQLEKILEKAGLEKDIHYYKEHNLKTDEGANQRLDYIINLPDDKHLILDSKVSLTAYNQYYNETDELVKEKLLKDHLTSIAKHIADLSSRNYQKLDVVQPDYVLMFLANEPALTLALKEDSSLFEKALEKNIVLVSTSTLLATLRTISYIWKTDKQNKNAKEIANQAAKLYEKFVGFTNDLIDVGRKMDSTTKSYESAMKKLSEGRGNLVRQVENIKKLGANTTQTVNPALVERSTNSNIETE